MTPAQTDTGEKADGFALRGANHLAMRARNERLLLTLLRRHGALPKSEIARRTGLSAQAVSVIMRKLEAEGLLLRGEPQRGKVGQPSVPMELAPDGAFFFGVKVGRRRTEVALVDFLGKVLREDVTWHDYPTPEKTLSFALAAIRRQLAAMPEGQRARVAGLGVGLPFQLWDWAVTLGIPTEAMAGWRDYDLAGALERELGWPVAMENDASAACNAELVFGTTPLPDNFLHLFVGFFVGGGLVLNGALFRGHTGNAGAMASMPVTDRNGQPRQLVELASLHVLERLHSQRTGSPPAAIWEGTENWAIAPELLEDWLAGAAHGIAQTAAAAVALCDLDAVVIDGWLAPELRARLVAKVHEAIGALDLAGLRRPALIEGSAGAAARSVGAASLVLSDRFMLDLARE